MKEYASITYTDSRGNVFDLMAQDIRWINSATGFHEYEWVPESTTRRFGERLRAWSKKAKEFTVTLIFEGSEDDRANMLNTFHDALEYDIINFVPGVLQWEEYSIKCYGRSSKTSPVSKSELAGATANEVIFYAPNPFWTKMLEYKEYDAQDNNHIDSYIIDGATPLSANWLSDTIISLPISSQSIFQKDSDTRNRNDVPYHQTVYLCDYSVTDNYVTFRFESTITNDSTTDSITYRTIRYGIGMPISQSTSAQDRTLGPGARMKWAPTNQNQTVERGDYDQTKTYKVTYGFGTSDYINFQVVIPGKWNYEAGDPLIPQVGYYYDVKTPGEYYGKTYQWNGSAYLDLVPEEWCKDYEEGYDYGLNSGDPGYDYMVYFEAERAGTITNTNVLGSKYIMEIYGPAETPYVAIRNNITQKEVVVSFPGSEMNIPAGGVLRVNSIDKTAILTTVEWDEETQGYLKVNWFGGRDLNYYLWDTVDYGPNAVIINGNYRVKLQLYEERSEPKWLTG